MPGARRPKRKVVKVGDPSRRVSVTLPFTLRDLSERVVELFGADKNSFTLWLDPGSHGRAPGRGRIPIESEVDYAKIQNDDVVVLCVHGREVDLRRACYFESTQQADYPAHPYCKAQPIARKTPAHLKNKSFGESSHRRDYVAPPSDYERRRSTKRAEDDIYGNRKFVATTTYNDTYIQHPLALTKPYKQTQAPIAARVKELNGFVSSYCADYNGKMDDFVPARPYIPNINRYESKHEPMVTSYQAEYVEYGDFKRQMPSKIGGCDIENNKPFVPGCSTYQRDYTEKKKQSRRVYIEPQKKKRI